MPPVVHNLNGIWHAGLGGPESIVVQRNERWAETLGYTLKNFGNDTDTWTSLIHTDDRDAASEDERDRLISLLKAAPHG